MTLNELDALTSKLIEAAEAARATGKTGADDIGDVVASVGLRRADAAISDLDEAIAAAKAAE